MQDNQAGIIKMHPSILFSSMENPVDIDLENGPEGLLVDFLGGRIFFDIPTIEAVVTFAKGDTIISRMGKVCIVVYCTAGFCLFLRHFFFRFHLRFVDGQ